MHLRFYFNVAGTAVDIRVAGSLRRQRCAMQIHLGPSAAMPVTHSAGSALHHSHAENRLRFAGGRRRRVIRNLGAQDTREQQGQAQLSHLLFSLYQ